MMKFSVLMSIYIKENPSCLREALRSLEEQTLKASEYIIVKDGPITEQLDSILQDFKNREANVKIIQLEKNKGLGLALREGITHCSYEWVARMDTDDIARRDRFEKQILFIEKNPDIAICGTWLEEFDNDNRALTTITRLPISDKDIKMFMKYRNPFRHATVMLKKSSVLSVGNYRDFLWFEDYDLFVRLLANGYKGYNIPEILMDVRVGKDMIARRGGLKYIKIEVKFMKFMYQQGIIGFSRFVFNTLSRTIVRLMPGKLRSYIYYRFLRN